MQSGEFMTLPPVNELKYDKEKLGYFGELGNGAHAQIRFLQSAVTKDELDNITLIENIPGSDRWEIRDLFQRDVDMVRVEESILPYLKDATNVKFFNPLTLVLLPIDSAKNTVDADVPYVKPEQVSRGEHQYLKYERDGLFCLEKHEKFPAYSNLRWNSSKVKLVAIDGQHRLSALKFWKDAPGGPKDLDTWQIPVVILGIFRADDIANHKPANLLEIVRKTFVYINTRAEEVNEARRILLDDEKLQAICAQEVIQASHKNDCLPDGKRDDTRLPLLFFDWRGQVRWRKDESEVVAAPGSVVSISEVHDWLSEYILGDNPNIALQLDDLDPPLSENYRERLTNDDSKVIRKRFLEVIYPGFSFLLDRFAPFRTYIEKVRVFEKSKCKDSEAATYAFQKLRFGSHPLLSGQMKDLVDESFKEIVETLKKMLHDCLDALVERDIGMRAIVFAFAELKTTRDVFKKKTSSWKEHAEWFVPKLNSVYADGWFKAHPDLSTEQRKILTHICFDAAGGIINYKIGDVSRALGPLLALLVWNQALGELTQERKVEIWDKYSEVLDPTLRRGFRKEHKARLKDTFAGTQAEFIEQVNKAANKSVIERLKLIEKKVINLGA
jgi:hypothetical protein